MASDLLIESIQVTVNPFIVLAVSDTLHITSGLINYFSILCSFVGLSLFVCLFVCLLLV